MELQSLTKLMFETSQRVDKATRTIYKMAEEKANAEYAYRKALGEKILHYRAEGHPATLIADLARSEVSELKLERDLKRDLFKSAISSLDALKTEISVLQTISKHQNEIGG